LQEWLNCGVFVVLFAMLVMYLHFFDIFGLTVWEVGPISPLIESDGAAGDGTMRSGFAHLI